MESSIQIEERAAAWLAKRDSDDWTAADEETFTGWLEASTANRVAYLRLEAAWEAAQRLQVFAAGTYAPTERQQHPFFRASPSHPSEVAARELEERAIDAFSDESDDSTAAVAHFRASVSVARRRLAHPIRAIAVGLLVAAALGIAWYVWPSGPYYRTAIGGVAAVPMPDGSRITLNTNSEVRVAVSDTERHVELAQGEAFFEVAKDPKRPFVVEAGSQRFIAVGTKFSVLRKEGANRLIVTEGRVRIEESPTILSRVSQLPAAVTGEAPKVRAPSIEVSAGGIARSGDAGVLVEERPIADAEVMLSWRSGYLVFKDTTLADAVAEFNRYSRDKIVIEDAAVAGIVIGGNFRSTNVDAFVRLLEDGFPIRVERQDRRIVLTKN